MTQLQPFSIVAKCEKCGATAQLHHVLPHPSEPVDQFVYHCTWCATFTTVIRPRSSAHSTRQD